jgi:hypothetical protein
MAKRSFLLPVAFALSTLAAAPVSASVPTTLTEVTMAQPQAADGLVLDRAAEHAVQMAAHASHSSHASHASHSSHSSHASSSR